MSRNDFNSHLNKTKLIVHIGLSCALTLEEKRYLSKLVRRDRYGCFVEAEPVQGFSVWKCSKCGKEIAGTLDGICFCAYCGARMKEGRTP